MVNVIYLAYGRTRFTKATVVSILSLLHHAGTMRDSFRIVVYTDAPELFTRHGISAELLPVDRIVSDASDFSHRRKLIAVQDCAALFGGDLLLVDGDTYLMGSPAVLFDALAGGQSVLHTREFVVSDSTLPGLARVLRETQFEQPRLQTAQRRSEIVMWNAGVVGLPERLKVLVPETIAITDELWRAHRYHTMEQFAWSLVLGDETEVRPADDVIYHYWHGREELTYRATKFLRAHRHLAPSELVEAAGSFAPKVSSNWTPPASVRLRQQFGTIRRKLIASRQAVVRRSEGRS